MTVEVSFIMNTMRDFGSFGSIVVDSILELENKRPFEILVYSPENPNCEHVTWLKEEIVTGGAVYGYNVLANAARGKYIIHVVDDYTLSPNYLEVIRHLDEDYKDKEFKITTPGIKVYNGGLIGPQNIDMGRNSYTGEGLDIDTNTHILKFPAYTRDMLKKLDYHIFHPDFIHSACDNFVSFHLCAQGQPVVEYQGVYMDCFGYMNGAPTWDRHDNDVGWYLSKNYTGKHVGFTVGLTKPEELRDKYEELCR